MRHGLRFALLGMGLCVLVLGMVGCTKRVPLESGLFEAQQKVVVTFKDGRTLEGRIAPGNDVTYTEDLSVYHARVAAVTETSIDLEELNLVDQGDSYRVVRARLADARRWIDPPAGPVTLSRDEVDKVELVEFDAAKMARITTFWGYGAAAVALLLGERS